MAKTFQELMADLRKELTEIEPEQLAKMRSGQQAISLIDVREMEEFRQGSIPGAIHIPRGFLELKIEDTIPDRKTPVVLFCAGGTRSLLAAESLRRLGYGRVSSLIGGFRRWKEEGRDCETPAVLGDWERQRYARHLTIPEVGEEGQKRLLGAKVLLIGAGGLGSPAAYYLGAAGVGTIGICDFDLVDESNLQRQILHTTDRVGTEKTESAKITLLALNPRLKVETFNERLSSENVARIFEPFDVIVDGSDNFPTRYLVNDASVLLGIPNVHGSVYRFEGQVTVFWPGKGPCYRCLYPEPPPAEMAPSCAEAGVLGILPGVIGLLEAVETIKIILGIGDILIGRLLAYDALKATFHELKLRKNPECAYCRSGIEFPGFIDYEQFCAVPSADHS